jgi:hypothetical protein
MNRTFVTALLTAASLMAPTGASAQRRQQATIPFDFTVGQVLLPAGTYMITHVTPGVIAVRGWKGKELVGTMTMIRPADGVRRNADQLIFHRYGDQYFLSELRGDLGESAGSIGASELEQRFQRQQAAAPNQDNTVIALK